MTLAYEQIRKRIDDRCKLLGVKSVSGIADERLAELRENAKGVSTLELTHLSRALSMSISYIVFGKES